MKEKVLLVILGGVLAGAGMYFFHTPAHAAPMQMVTAGRYVFQAAKVSAYVANSDGFMSIDTVVRGDYQTGDVWVLQATATSLLNPNFAEVNWKKVTPAPPAPPAPDSLNNISNEGF